MYDSIVVAMVEYKQRCIDAIAGDHTIVRAKDIRIKARAGALMSDRVCLEWSSARHRTYFRQATSIIEHILMGLARSSISSDIVVYEIIPRMFEARLDLTTFVARDGMQLTGWMLDDCSLDDSFVVAVNRHSINFDALHRVRNLRCDAYYTAGTTCSLRWRFASGCGCAFGGGTVKRAQVDKIIIPCSIIDSGAVYCTNGIELAQLLRRSYILKMAATGSVDA